MFTFESLWVLVEYGPQEWVVKKVMKRAASTTIDRELGWRFGACKMYLSPSMAYAAVCSRAVFLLLLICCIMYFPLFVGVPCLPLFCYALLRVHSSFAILLKRTRKLVALLLLSYRYIVHKCSVAFSSRCRGLSAVCDCCISCSYSLTFLLKCFQDILMK